MEYFILDVDKKYTPPNLIDWFGRLDKQTLSGKQHYELPKRMIFATNDSIQTVQTDVIMHPCFMVSKKMRKAIEMYDPFVQFSRIILFSKRNSLCMDYHIPFLTEIDCLTEKSSFNLDKSVLHHAQVDGDKIVDKVIVRVAGLNHTCILVREDFVESLLCRKMIGIGLRETEVV